MQYVHSLDTYRFVAFFIVLISHATLFLHLGVSNLHTGDLGVSMFFVLSGFLITTILWTQLQKTGDIDLSSFYAKRIRRIIPLYLVIITIGLILIPAFYTTEYFREPFTNLTHNPLWQYLTFTFNFYNTNHFVANTLITTMLWSICVEEQFYLVWPTVVKYIKKAKHLLYILGTLFFISLTFRFINFDNSAVIEFNTFSVMNDLIIGCVLAIAYYYNRAKIESYVTGNGFLYISAFMLFLVYFRSEFLIGNQVWVTLEPIIFALCFSYILIAFVKFKNWEVFNFPFIVYLGKISYGLYVYHILSFFIAIQLVIFLNQYIPLSGHFELIFSLPILLAVSHISYKYFETRIMKKKIGAPVVEAPIANLSLNK